MSVLGAMRWWLRFVSDVAMIVAAMTACHLTLWAVPLAMLVIGSRLHAIGVIGHMATHRYCGPTSKILNAVAFFPIALSPAKYRDFHFRHHRHLGTAEDPELHYIYAFRHKWERTRLRDSVCDLLGLNIHEFVVILSAAATWRSVSALVMMLAIIAWAIGPLALVLIGSYVTTLLFVFRLRSRAEHDHVNQPGMTFAHEKPSWWVRFLYLPHGHWQHQAHHAGVRGV